MKSSLTTALHRTRSVRVTSLWERPPARGGGHAVVNWIVRNLDREVLHLNNAFVKPLKARWRGRRSSVESPPRIASEAPANVFFVVLSRRIFGDVTVGEKAGKDQRK